MVRSGLFFSWPLRLGALVGLVTCVCCGGSSGQGPANNASPQAVPPLSADDVSLLFPGPTRAEDFAKLIAVSDLSTRTAGSHQTRSRLARCRLSTIS